MFHCHCSADAGGLWQRRSFRSSGSRQPVLLCREGACRAASACLLHIEVD
jgi:hypothetical protein